MAKPIRAFLSRVYPGGHRDTQSPRDMSVPEAIEFVIGMLQYGASITVLNASRMTLISQELDSGCDDDRLESDRMHIHAIAMAIVYYHEIASGPRFDWEHENLRRALVMTRVSALQRMSPEVREWLDERPTFTNADLLRVAVMLACDVHAVDDLEAGLAIPPPKRLDADRTFIAALELVLESYGHLTMRDVVAAVVPEAARTAA